MRVPQQTNAQLKNWEERGTSTGTFSASPKSALSPFGLYLFYPVIQKGWGIHHFFPSSPSHTAISSFVQAIWKGGGSRKRDGGRTVRARARGKDIRLSWVMGAQKKEEREKKRIFAACGPEKSGEGVRWDWWWGWTRGKIYFGAGSIYRERRKKKGHTHTIFCQRCRSQVFREVQLEVWKIWWARNGLGEGHMTSTGQHTTRHPSRRPKGMTVWKEVPLKLANVSSSHFWTEIASN